MLPLGRITLRGFEIGGWEGQEGPRWTHLGRNDQMMMMTAWSLAQSPLMFGGNLPDNDEWTTSLLNNPDMLAVNQDPLGIPLVPMDLAPFPIESWVKRLHDGALAVGFFNRTGQRHTINVLWQDLGLGPEVMVRDLWNQEDLGAQSEYTTVMPDHGSVLLRVRPMD